MGQLPPVCFQDIFITTPQRRAFGRISVNPSPSLISFSPLFFFFFGGKTHIGGSDGKAFALNAGDPGSGRVRKTLGQEDPL